MDIFKTFNQVGLSFNNKIKGFCCSVLDQKLMNVFYLFSGQKNVFNLFNEK